MIDFTLDFYKTLIKTVQNNFNDQIITFSDFLSAPGKPERFCIIRHDVDRNHSAALRMAIYEAELGVQASYYFRTKNQRFNENVIRRINDLGHEVGFHYESLASARGNYQNALADFKNCIRDFQNISKISTISMHGSPLSKYNNLDLWQKFDRMKVFDELGLIGDVVLDIDFSDIAFITDTGRNWQSQKGNLRDKVKSLIAVELKNSRDLLEFIENPKYGKIVLQIHPERWSDNLLEWTIQLIKDKLANAMKRVLRRINAIQG